MVQGCVGRWKERWGLESAPTNLKGFRFKIYLISDFTCLLGNKIPPCKYLPLRKVQSLTMKTCSGMTHTDGSPLVSLTFCKYPSNLSVTNSCTNHISRGGERLVLRMLIFLFDSGWFQALPVMHGNPVYSLSQDLERRFFC